jgi:hypothetical protein
MKSVTRQPSKATPKLNQMLWKEFIWRGPFSVGLVVVGTCRFCACYDYRFVMGLRSTEGHEQHVLVLESRSI